MSTTTDLTTLKINYLTQSQYEEALDSNTIGANEIYMTPAADFTRGKVGVITAYAGADEPTGWLQCDGRAISRTTYAELFNVIGTTYGAGDGSTTFNIPDLRNQVLVGAGDNYDLADTGGEAEVELIESELPAISAAFGIHGQESGTIFYQLYNNATGTKLTNKYHTTATTDNQISGSAYSYTQPGIAFGGDEDGNTVPHENMPPYVAINFLICYENNHISGAGNVNAQLITWEEAVER